MHVAAIAPAQLLQALQERCQTGLSFRTIPGHAHEHTETPHPAALLRTRHDRQRCCRAAEQREDFASLHHSITSSARASTVGGTSNPSIIAVAKLMTSSNLLACTTGKSADLAPLRMRPA
jgi:hypothetical protein